MIKMKWHAMFAQAALGFALAVGSNALNHSAYADTVPKISDKSVTGELAFWNLIKDSKNSGDFKSYLENFPNGMFFDPAMQKFLQTGGNKADLTATAGSPIPKAATEIKKADSVSVTTKLPIKPIVKIVRKQLPVKHNRVATRVMHRNVNVHCRLHMISKNGSCVAIHVVHKKLKRVALSHKKIPSTFEDQSSQTGHSGGGGSGGGGTGGGGGWH